MSLFRRGGQKNLPTFIIVGAMKCGTTSLHHYLDLSQSVFVSKRKELNFFIEERNWGKGLNWYKSQFRTDLKFIGESSPNYSKRHLFPGVAERLSKLLPDIKIIYLVKNPIDRLVSNYLHNYYRGREKREFHQLVDDKDTNFLLSGKYHYQIEPFLDHFSTDQIQFINSDNLKNDRQQTVQSVINFIGSPEKFSHSGINTLWHQTSHKRRKKILKKIFFLDFKKIVPPRKEVKVIDSQRSFLTEYYLEDIEKFEKISGMSLKYWFDFESN